MVVIHRDFAGFDSRSNGTSRTCAQKSRSGSIVCRQKVAQTPNQEASDTSLGGLYVFVDEQGVPHYSLQPLDERYVLFSSAGLVMDKDVKLAVAQVEKNWRCVLQRCDAWTV